MNVRIKGCLPLSLSWRWNERPATKPLRLWLQNGTHQIQCNTVYLRKGFYNRLLKVWLQTHLWTSPPHSLYYHWCWTCAFHFLLCWSNAFKSTQCDTRMATGGSISRILNVGGLGPQIRAGKTPVSLSAVSLTWIWLGLSGLVQFGLALKS